MRLYYVPRTRAVRPRLLLEELGVPYELVRLDRAAGMRTPEHLAVHPLGRVPALEDGELRMFESGAICLYLAERYGNGRLLPPPGTAARAKVYQWLFFAVTELEPALDAISAARRAAPEERDDAAIARAEERASRALSVLDAALAGSALVAGEALTVADVLVGPIASWAAFLQVPVAGERLPAYVARLKARPAYRRATAD